MLRLLLHRMQHVQAHCDHLCVRRYLFLSVTRPHCLALDLQVEEWEELRQQGIWFGKY
jgi:hypothetical protein